jgi:hypothetical protein
VAYLMQIVPDADRPTPRAVIVLGVGVVVSSLWLTGCPDDGGGL